MQKPRAVHLHLKYRVLGFSAAAGRASGTGRTVDFGRGILRFCAEKPLPVGALLEIAIPWAIPLDGKIRLKLIVRGRIVRCENALITLKIEKYEFRTAGMVTATALAEVGAGRHDVFSKVRRNVVE